MFYLGTCIYQKPGFHHALPSKLQLMENLPLVASLKAFAHCTTLSHMTPWLVSWRMCDVNLHTSFPFTLLTRHSSRGGFDMPNLHNWLWTSIAHLLWQKVKCACASLWAQWSALLVCGGLPGGGGGGGGGGGTQIFSSTGCAQPTMKWGSKELTTRVKYRVLGTTELSGRVKNGI